MGATLPIQRSDRRRTYQAAVGQTVFDFPFVLFDPLDLRVSLRTTGAVTFTALAYPSLYSVVIDPTTQTAQVTLATAARPGAADPAVEVRVEGVRIHERVTDVARAGVVQSVPVEREFDRQTVIDQELRRDIDDCQRNVALALATVGGASVWALAAFEETFTAWFLTLPTTQPPLPGFWWNNGGVPCRTVPAT